MIAVHVTAHALDRLEERCGIRDAELMRRELRQAIADGRVRTREPRWLRPTSRRGRRWKEDRARFAWPEDRSRVYVFQRCRLRGRVIVTVLTRRHHDDPWLWVPSEP